MYHLPSYHTVPDRVPGDIAVFVTPQVWNEIREIHRQVDDTAQANACLVTCAGCILCGNLTNRRYY